MTTASAQAGTVESPTPDLTIAFAFDDAFVPHFATCALSMAASRANERIDIVLLSGPTLSPDAEHQALHYARELGFTAEAIRPPAEALAALPSTRLFSPLVWHRLLLCDLLPDRDRVISMDADTLVLQSLAPLWAHDLADNLVGAVSSTSQAWVDHYRRIGLTASQRYFNAGVLLLNLQAMRESNTVGETIRLGHERFDDFTFAEQDALNFVLRDRWLPLHPKWNAMSPLWVMPSDIDGGYSPLEVQTARASPAIVHFEGGPIIKPWYYRSCHPLRALYRDYRADTPWPLASLEGAGIVGAVMRRLPVKSQYAVQRTRASVVSLSRPGSR